MEPSAASERDSPENRAAKLKERIYISFTALAVVLALRSHSEHLELATAASTLAITVAGTLLAVFVADLLSHLAVHAVLPTRAELRHMVGVSVGALGAVVLPFAFLGASWAGWMEVPTALQAGAIALVVALVIIARVAVRRTRLPKWQRFLLLLGVAGLGFAVVALELLAHG